MRRAGRLAVLLSLSLVATVALAGTAAAATGALGMDDARTTTLEETGTPAVGGPRTTTSGTDPGDNRTAPPDPPADRLGWESVDGQGVWYNESLAVDPSDGLNDTELDRVVARAMARIEVIRELEYRSEVPVTVISRATFAERTAARFRTLSEAERLRQNVKFEAMFVVGEDEDAVATLRGTRSSAVLGFYRFDTDRITLVSDETPPTVDEVTLAQELFHALQDQQFDPPNRSWYPGQTSEAANTANAVIEGDANYVDYLYATRCQAEWDCLRPPLGDRDDGGETNAGVSLLQAFPYSDGPVLVRRLHQQGGWPAVDDLYENPPASTEQVIHPEKFRTDSPTNVTVPDRSSGAWRRLTVDGVDRLEYGEAGLVAMVAYPTFAPEGTTLLIRRGDFLTGETIGPYNYDFPVTSGWDGDALYPYVTDRSAETNETGYVWRLVWDSPADARAFAEAYRALLQYNDARRVQGRADTWRAVEAARFDDAFYLNVSGDTVTIVNAPTVEALPAVHAGAAPEVESTPTATATVTPTETVAPTSISTETTTTRGASGAAGGGRGLPGLGVVAALVAVAAGLAVLSRRR